jgi:hypothetical protein
LYEGYIFKGGEDAAENNSIIGYSRLWKTRRRTTEAGLKDLPYIDIADFYTRANQNGVFSELIMRLDEMVVIHDHVVVEMSMNPNRRAALERLAHERFAELEIIEMGEEVSTCIVRVEEQQYEELMAGRLTPERERFHQARLRWLHSLREQELSAQGLRLLPLR